MRIATSFRIAHTHTCIKRRRVRTHTLYPLPDSVLTVFNFFRICQKVTWFLFLLRLVSRLIPRATHFELLKPNLDCIVLVLYMASSPYFMPPFYGGIFNTPRRCDRTKLFCLSGMWRGISSDRQSYGNSPTLRTAHKSAQSITVSLSVYLSLYPTLFRVFSFCLLISILGLKMSSAFFKLNSVLARIIWHWLNKNTPNLCRYIVIYTLYVYVFVFVSQVIH